jgi:DNA-binding MarR family transcriptional regulator
VTTIEAPKPEAAAAVATLDLGGLLVTVRAEIARPAARPWAGNLAQFARALQRERRQRDTVFALPLFREPAWDILLDLFTSASEGKRVTISSACVAAAVPPTTALRHLGKLEALGLITRRREKNLRIVYLELSDLGRTKMAAALETMLNAASAPPSP